MPNITKTATEISVALFDRKVITPYYEILRLFLTKIKISAHGFGHE